MVSTSLPRVDVIFRSWNPDQIATLYFSCMSQAKVLDNFQKLFRFESQDPQSSSQCQITTSFSQYYRFKIKKKFNSIAAFREAKESAKAILQEKLKILRFSFLLIIARSSCLLLFTEETFSGKI